MTLYDLGTRAFAVFIVVSLFVGGFVVVGKFLEIIYWFCAVIRDGLRYRKKHGAA